MKDCSNCPLLKAAIEKIEDKREIIRRLSEKKILIDKKIIKFDLLLPN